MNLDGNKLLTKNQVSCFFEGFYVGNRDCDPGIPGSCERAP